MDGNVTAAGALVPLADLHNHKSPAGPVLPDLGGCTALLGGCTALLGGCTALLGGCAAPLGGCTALLRLAMAMKKLTSHTFGFP